MNDLNQSGICFVLQVPSCEQPVALADMIVPCGEMYVGDLIAYRDKHVVEVYRLRCMSDNTDIVVQGQSCIATEIDNRLCKGGRNLHFSQPAVLFRPSHGYRMATGCAS